MFLLWKNNPINDIYAVKHVNKEVLKLFRPGYAHITGENTPCWYEILWINDRLLLKIREEVFIHFQEFFVRQPETPLIIDMQERFKKDGYPLEAISMDPKISLGFGNQIRFLSEKKGFWTYLVPLPKADTDALQVSATLTLATSLLRSFNMKAMTESESIQQLTFATNTDIGFYGAPIAGEIGIPLRNFLAQLDREERMEAKDFIDLAMVRAWKKMHGKVNFHEKNKLSFKLEKGGFFHLDCPGNACGLDPCDYPESLDKGYEFCPHNTDTPKQQLALLTGLAAICTLAKKS